MIETHRSVLLTEAIEALNVQSNHWYVDATFGGGGHTASIIEKKGNVIAFDFDKQAVETGQQRFAQEIKQGQLILIHENFDRLEAEVKKIQREINGILFDFGTSTEQLMSTERGLSFQGEDDELDMRLVQRLGVKAKDLLAVLNENQLTEVFGVYGGEREARKIAKEIATKRKKGEFLTTVGQLVKLITRVKFERSSKINPATRVFQGLRIAVNDELGNIERALPQALNILKPGGIIVTIAFHEGEDRIAKHLFKEWEMSHKGELQHKKVLIPSEEEVHNNPRSRSAKMRVFKKENKL
jgi:16S rRNA (cytosine1402-N4)-methyltransferase